MTLRAKDKKTPQKTVKSGKHTKCMLYSQQISFAFICSIHSKNHSLIFFGKSLSSVLCLSFFFFYPSTSKWSRGVVDAKPPPARCVPTRRLKRLKGLVGSRGSFRTFYFPSRNSGSSIVEVTPTESHKHSLADCLPSQC